MNTCPFYNKPIDETCKSLRDDRGLCPSYQSIVCEELFDSDKSSFVFSIVVFCITLVLLVVASVVVAIGYPEASCMALAFMMYCCDYVSNCGKVKESTEKELLMKKLHKTVNEKDEEVSMADVQTQIDTHDSL